MLLITKLSPIYIYNNIRLQVNSQNHLPGLINSFNVIHTNIYFESKYTTVSTLFMGQTDTLCGEYINNLKYKSHSPEHIDISRPIVKANCANIPKMT